MSTGSGGRERQRLQVGTATGAVSAFAIVPVAACGGPEAAPIGGAAVPGGATLRGVPLGTAVAAGTSPVAQLAAQMLCTADVPSLRQPPGSFEAEDGDEGPTGPSAWRDAFPGQGAAIRGPCVIAVRPPCPPAPALCCSRGSAGDWFEQRQRWHDLNLSSITEPCERDSMSLELCGRQVRCTPLSSVAVK